MAPTPPFAAAILQSIMFQAASDIALVAGTTTAPRAPPRQTAALHQMLKAVKGRVRKDSKNATADRGTQAAIEPERTEQGSQTDKDIGGFEAHVRTLSGQQALAAREKREAVAAQQKEHKTYRHALKRTLRSIEALRTQNAALAADAECAWRLAQSRGVLGPSASAGLSAWTDPLVLPATFGSVSEDDTRELLAAVARSLVAAEAERRADAGGAAEHSALARSAPDRAVLRGPTVPPQD